MCACVYVCVLCVHVCDRFLPFNAASQSKRSRCECAHDALRGVTHLLLLSVHLAMRWVTHLLLLGRWVVHLLLLSVHLAMRWVTHLLLLSVHLAIRWITHLLLLERRWFLKALLIFHANLESFVFTTAPLTCCCCCCCCWGGGGSSGPC